MSDQDQQRADERARRQTDSAVAAAGHKVAVQEQSRKVHQQKHNPQFYEKFTESSVADSDELGELIDEHAAWFADDRLLSNRRQVHRLQRQLLNQVRAEQSIVSGSPGQRLKEKPLLHALAQGVRPQLDAPVRLDAAGQQSISLDAYQDYDRALAPDEKTAMDDLAKVASARDAMGVDSAGADALTTASTEQKTVREDRSDEERALSGVSGVLD